MAGRSHLTPVPTTDRRGRLTTVYRNLAARLLPSGRYSGSAALPPVAAEKPVVPAPAAPTLPCAFREPKPLTTAELENLASDLASHLGPSSPIQPIHEDELRAMVVTEEAGRAAAALAAEAVEGGVLTKWETYILLMHAAQAASHDLARPGIDPKVGAHTAHVLLLVATTVAARHPQRGHRWSRDLIEATKGALLNRRDAPVTEAQLDALAAVVEFTMEDTETPEKFTYKASAVGTGDHRALKSHHLDQLLRDRPHDLDRILQYIQDRDTHSMDTKEDVDRLREWLDATEGTTAVGEGWL